MNIYEYQAKRIFKRYGINVPKGIIAYTPNEAKDAANKISSTGSWMVKAQILANKRQIGKFSDARAGKKGGIRYSKNIDEVYKNASNMLENILVTTSTTDKGSLVSRVYIEQFIKTKHKFYFSLVTDWVSATIKLLISPEKNTTQSLTPDFQHILNIDLGLQKQLSSSQLSEIIDFMKVSTPSNVLKKFFNSALAIFHDYDATLLEIDPIGIDETGKIWALDAKITFDRNALHKHPDVLKITEELDVNEREFMAAKFGFQYKELDSGIGIIVNGDGLALNIINEAQHIGLNSACFLNLKGGVDRDKIAASIKLIMTNPKVDGIFINILGGFLRCNLIADGILSVANDLGLNIPLIVRFEGTNKEEATAILKKSGLLLSIVDNATVGLNMLKSAIMEDL